MTRAFFNWSSGKDSALALYYLKKRSDLEIDQLLTTVNGHHDRVSMHGLRCSLLRQQADALNLPLGTIVLPEEPTMDEYERIMMENLDKLKQDGYYHCGFGDIFLEDIKTYREKQFVNLECHFPLWKKDTTALIHEFIDLGFKAIVVCINGELLDTSFTGRELDHTFLSDLPKAVDPCGENGEFHTFCYDGPIFSKPIEFNIGEKVIRTYPSHSSDTTVDFCFVDLIPHA